jgi:nucleotide-binding universal stress UspA family protein
MGAYGYSETIEDLFGGVTGRTLVRAKCPLLLAH